MSDVLRDAAGFEAAMARLHEFGDLFFSEDFLEPRPLLRALREEGGAVLLIDEIDKSDEEFEAFLLEVLSAHQVTIPELGTIKADMPPVTFLTSNNTRDLGDALKRRCLHLYIPLPDARLERRIVETRVPDAGRIAAAPTRGLRAAATHPRASQAPFNQRDHRLGEGPSCCSTPASSNASWSAIP